MEEPELVMSPLCRAVEHDGQTVDVEIYRSDSTGWSLEVVDALGHSTIWFERFDTDQKALDEFNRTILEEGISVLVGPACDCEA